MSSNTSLPIPEEPTRDVASAPECESMGFASVPSLQQPAIQPTPIGDDADVPKQIGDYQIRQLIGSGGMGNVYLAEHTRMQRIVAIKMLPIDRMKDASAVSRFYDEVRAASRLLHPNIVTAFDAGESDDGIHYLAMEYVDGVTLTRLVATRGPLSVPEAAGVIRQAALGLLHAHRAGIVHRDVKPGNLMRAKDGTIKVLDLGLARINAIDTGGGDEKVAPETQTSSKGRLIGTLPFMSPEQLEDADGADSRSDIYSLGATLYFLLTASPPFTGEYLDQVYGHRHGEIPDLMQARGDIDLHFANIFRRMMAKSPGQRYGSLDEVIDELGEYASGADAPVWLSEFAGRPIGGDASTFAGGSTSGATSRVMAIDFGMFYSSAAEASPLGGVLQLSAGGPEHPLFRMAVAADGDSLAMGNAAIELRAARPRSLVHCLPMYIGKEVVDRKIAGRACPPEVLMAMMMRRITENAWTAGSPPQATAITVPASYDQLHRRSILQAASMAKLPSVRLVDRSIAAVQSLLVSRSSRHEGDETESDDVDFDDANLNSASSNGASSNSANLNGANSNSASSSDSDRVGVIGRVAPDAAQLILFVGVSGQASEVAVIRRDESRLHQISTSGHWHTGTLPWLHRLVDLAAEAFVSQHGFDPRSDIQTAAGLQIACEKAMNAMLLATTVTVRVTRNGQEKAVKIDRQDWLDMCSELIGGLRKAIERACAEASLSMDDFDVMVTLGPVLRIAAVRDVITAGMRENVPRHSVDRLDVARGAAACLAAELPGRGDIAMPPRSVSAQSIGIVVEDSKGRRRIWPIIPKGTSLPARTNRRLSISPGRETMTLSLVETSGVDSDDWHALGRYQIEGGDPGRSDSGKPNDSKSRSRMIGFEVNVNGLLSVRVQSQGSGPSTKLAALPTPMIDDEQLADWTKWIDSVT